MVNIKLKANEKCILHMGLNSVTQFLIDQFTYIEIHQY